MVRTTTWKMGARVLGLATMAAAAAAGGPGCGSVGDKADPIQTAPTRIASTVCPKAYTCCTAMQLMGNQLAGTNLTTCQEKTSEAFTNQLSAVSNSQRLGRVRYDDAKLTACLDYIETQTCETLAQTNHFSGVPGCNSFVEPLVVNGGACDYDWECTGGQCLNHVCRSLPAAGQACSDGKCAAGAICQTNSLTCVALNRRGDSCVDGNQCESGVCTNSACAPPPAETCFYSSGCSAAGRGPASLALVAGAAVLMAALARRRRIRARRVNA